MPVSNPRKVSELEDFQNINHPHLLLFELSVGGHYPGYIQHLVRYWCGHNLTRKLTVVVSPKFIEQHGDVLESAVGYETKVQFIPVTMEEEAALLPRKSPLHRAIRATQMWHLLCKYVTSIKASHCLVMYLDSFQTSLALGTKAPCPISGIYFRPTFHYGTLTHYHPSWKDLVQQWREKLILPRILAHPQLQTVFCLDPLAIEPLRQFSRNNKVIQSPDPVQAYVHSEDDIADLRRTLRIKPDKLIFLMFGALDGRKGIHQLLEAALMLPPNLGQKLCLLFVGPLKPADNLLMQPRLTQLAETSGVQVVLQDTFIPDHEIQPYFQLADVILALYQRHMGMSAILARAATSGKPVLSSNYGLMGEITRLHDLGLTVDSTVPGDIAQRLIHLLTEPLKDIGDQQKMQQFAEQNTAERFAQVIFQNLGVTSGVKQPISDLPGR